MVLHVFQVYLRLSYVDLLEYGEQALLVSEDHLSVVVPALMDMCMY